MTTLGAVIAIRLKELGMTQGELAYALDFSKQYINDIVRGNRHPRDGSFLQHLGAVLHLQEDYLFFLVGVLPPDSAEIEATSEQIMAAFKAMRDILQERNKL